MESRRSRVWVYGLIIAVWGLILGWQVVEHSRVTAVARAELRNRAKDISTTVGIVLRSQRRFGVISKERVEPALAGLIRPDELTAVALLNAAGQIVASAPTNVDLRSHLGMRQPELWEENSVTIINLVDLGVNVARDLEGTNPPIVLSLENFARPGETNRPPPPDRDNRPPPDDSGDMKDGRSRGRSNSDEDRRGRGDGDRRPRFGRPPWMSETEFQTMIEKQGVHSFLMVLSTETLRDTVRRDLWLRWIIVSLTTLSVVGFGLAWRNTLQAAELQIRLVRAS
jgi:hypothetical protein